jgi:hypothetical protein
VFLAFVVVVVGAAVLFAVVFPAKVCCPVHCSLPLLIISQTEKSAVPSPASMDHIAAAKASIEGGERTESDGVSTEMLDEQGDVEDGGRGKDAVSRQEDVDAAVEDAGEVYPNTQPTETQEDSDYYDVEEYLELPLGNEVVMWPGVRKGFVRKLTFEENGIYRSVYMKTLSLDPPIFGLASKRPCVCLVDVPQRFRTT